MAKAMKTTTDPVLAPQWQRDKNDLNDELVSVRNLIVSTAKRQTSLGHKTVISDDQLRNIVPMHPYAALILMQIAVLFTSNQRSTYTNWYIYDTKQMYDYDVSRLFLGDLPRNEGRVQEGSSVKVELFDGDYFVVYRSAASIARSGNVVPVESDYTAPEGTSIPTGIYTVGEEIPEGKYTIYFNGEAPSRVRTYANPEDATNDFKDPEFESVLAYYNTSAEINLKAGYAFRLEYNNIIMKKSNGFVFE